ncbi:MAG TPA: winged helix-turn-helix domain-containing protein, partial [Planctomycetota bacterium]|nr:winged helix-turn-helix domain-containing protein [Planctomycetota bacterium]
MSSDGPILPGTATLPPMDSPAGAGRKAVGTAAKAPGRPYTRSRFAVLNAFVDVSMAGVLGSDAKAWLVLYRDTKPGDGLARTSQTDMARRTGLALSTVKRAIKRLVAAGFL